jgi:hypothetical protein
MDRPVTESAAAGAAGMTDAGTARRVAKTIAWPRPIRSRNTCSLDKRSKL